MSQCVRWPGVREPEPGVGARAGIGHQGAGAEHWATGSRCRDDKKGNDSKIEWGRRIEKGNKMDETAFNI
jgi:hypothetical protein